MCRTIAAYNVYRNTKVSDWQYELEVKYQGQTLKYVLRLLRQCQIILEFDLRLITSTHPTSLDGG